MKLKLKKNDPHIDYILKRTKTWASFNDVYNLL